METFEPAPASVGLQKAVFANGCFWCTEAIFTSLKGVQTVSSGYAGGSIPNPTYEQISSGSTGHAEAIQIEYDPSIISYDDLLAVFFYTHDPTTLNRQGSDVGTQYRSAIFYTNDEQKQKAESLIKELSDAHAYDKPIVTEVKTLETFYPAEDYHQEYYKHHADQPYCQIVIAPKIEKLERKFAALLKK